MSLEGQNVELRRRLVIKGETISGHCDKVKALKKDFHHTIRCDDRPADGTCVTYALELLPSRWALCKEWQDMGVKPDREFVEWLLDEGLLNEIDDAEPGALALYFSGEEWEHAGIVQDGSRLVSKWGDYAVFNHGFSEVSAE